MLICGPFWYRVLCWVILFLATGRGNLCAIPNNVNLPEDDYLTIQQIIISGNTITKSRVILNELVFKQGEKVMANKIGPAIVRSKEKLLNTSLFNFVYIRHIIQSDNSVVIYVTVDERWYWWVFPIFEVADRNLSAFFDSQDWSRVNYGVYIKRDNFRGRNEKIAFRVRLGYTSQLLCSYTSPEFHKKSGWGFKVDLRLADQLPYRTIDNRPLYLGFNDKIAQYFYSGSVFYSLRSGIDHRHKLELAYTGIDVHDSIVALNSNYLTIGDNNLQYLEMKYEYQHDKRDSKVYPLKGRNWQLELVKTGFGIWNDRMDNFKARAKLDQHYKLADRWHWSTRLNGEINTGDHLPYALHTGLGYHEFINGYELFVINGNQQVMAKNQLVYTLLKPQVKHIGFMPINQFAKVSYAFYLKTFYDFGQVWQKNPPISNTFVNDWLYGYGAGLDFVTFYDMVWSFNYSFNKQGDGGFFVHFNLSF